MLVTELKRACDRCHVSKQKCDGRTPCQRCRKLDFPCTLRRPLLPKGPSPREAKRRRGLRRDSRSPSQTPTETTPVPSIASDILNVLDQDIDSSPESLLGEAGIDLEGGFGGKEGPTIDPLWLGPTDEDVIPSTSQLCGLQDIDNSQTNQAGPSNVKPTYGWQPDWLQSLGPGNAMIQLPNSGLSPLDAFPFPMLGKETPFLPNLFATSPTFLMPKPPIYSGRKSQSLANSAHIFNMPFCPEDDVSSIFTLTLETLIKPQLQVYFQRIYPMLLVIPPSYIDERISVPAWHRRPDFVAMVLSMTALSLIHPLYEHEVKERTIRAKQSKTLLEEACRLSARWDHGSFPTIESIMTSYLIFGVLLELGHMDGARLRLKEALSLGETMRLDDPATYYAIDATEAERRRRMYWVLAVTERAHALQRGGHLVFHGRLREHRGKVPDATSPSLWYLAHIFSFVDEDIIACWNGRCDRATCQVLTTERAVDMLSRLKGSVDNVFGPETDLSVLSDAQRADLLITWQWIRNRLWRLAAAHNLTTEDGPSELSAEYVVDIASTTVAICRQLSLASMEAHGAGFVEKIFDIANIVTSLLQSDVALHGRLLHIAQTDRWGEALKNLSHYVAQHRVGKLAYTNELCQAVSYVENIKVFLGPETGSSATFVSQQIPEVAFS